MTAEETRSRWVERCCVLALLLAALWPRARDLRAPFDREFEGAQGAFFAIGALNYERLGALRTGAYPVLNLDLGPRGDPRRSLWEHPQGWYRSEEHTSEPSHVEISYAVFCLKKKKKQKR